MSARLLSTAPPGTPEWHESRARRIGGSDVASILGLSKWTSAFSLWWQKSGQLEPEHDDPTDGPLYWGNVHEPVIAGEFAKRHPEMAVVPTGTWVDERAEWRLANPDRLVYTADDLHAILEIKTARTSDGWGDDGTDEIPPAYRCQVVWYMDILGVDLAYVAVLIAGSDYREYTIALDPDEAHRYRNEARDFVASIERGQVPPIDGAYSTGRTLRQLHPDVEDVEVEIPADVADNYRSAQESMAQAKQRLYEAENRVRAELGDGRAAVCDGRKVATRSVYTRRTVNTDLLRAEQPDIYAKYLTETTVNSLRASARRNP